MHTFVLFFILIVNVIIVPGENKSKGGGKGGKPKGHQLKGGKGDKSDKQPDKQPDQQPDVHRSTHQHKARGITNTNRIF